MSGLRDLLDAAAGEPPHRVSVEAVRRRVVRRRVLEGIAGTAVAAVIAVAIPAVAGTLGRSPAAPLTQTRPAGSTAGGAPRNLITSSR